MTNSNERLEKAKKILFEETPTDRIIDYYIGVDYVEFDCKAGGDTLTYRVYKNGKIYER